MRIPLSWLREFVDLAPGTTPADVHAALVQVGLEEEGVHSFDLSGPIVVGEVVEFAEEPQSNGKTIRWCQVRVAPDGETAADGGDAVRGIVCGANNFVVGDLVVVTLPGAVLPGPFPIAARKTYGHVSDGMMASAREIGLGEEQSGILRLRSLGINAPVGADAVALLGLDDQAVEINVTPDRGYAFSIRGVAREYSHSTGVVFRDPGSAIDEVDTDGVSFPVDIHDDAPIRGKVGASVFATRSVRGVDASRATPPWMVSRLTLAGIRSISLLVDITNYVMLELGQPLHGYDLDRLDKKIRVRRASEGETLTTLDGRERILHSEDLVIADDSGAIGLAGVMGGQATEIGSATVNVLIEAANFDPVSIARTARRHKLPSEASKRFERGVDPEIALVAASRAAQLIADLAGGEVEGSATYLRAETARLTIELPSGYAAALVGVEYTRTEIRDALAEIGAIVVESSDGYLVTPPSWRPDLTDKADLVEEIARIVGYERIPLALPAAPPGRGLSYSQRARRVVADTLAAAGGVEVLAYPWVNQEQNALFGSESEQEPVSIRLANPLDQTAPLMRRSLLPGLIGVAKRNLSRGLTDLSLFELGLVFLPEPGVTYGQHTLPSGTTEPTEAELSTLHRGIPPQPRHIAALVLGNAVVKQPGVPAQRAGIADALDVVRQIELAVGCSIDVAQGTHHALHPGRTAVLSVAGQPIGFAGELLPSLAESLDLPRVVGVVELNFDAVLAVSEGAVHATPILTYPAATQDISLVVAADVAAGDVRQALVDGAGALLEDLRLVDDYRGVGIEPGTKSLTFALRFRADDRTLTAAEASEAKTNGAARAAEVLNATVRE